MGLLRQALTSPIFVGLSQMYAFNAINDPWTVAARIELVLVQFRALGSGRTSSP